MQSPVWETSYLIFKFSLLFPFIMHWNLSVFNILNAYIWLFLNIRFNIGNERMRDMENTCWCTSFCPGYRAMMCSFISISVFQLDCIANVGSDSIRCCSMRATSCEIEYTTTYLITQWIWTLKRVGRIKLSWDVFQNIFYSTIALLFPSTHSSKIYWKVFCLKLLISFELIEKWKDGYAKTCSKLSHSARFFKVHFSFFSTSHYSPSRSHHELWNGSYRSYHTRRSLMLYSRGKKVEMIIFSK